MFIYQDPFNEFTILHHVHKSFSNYRTQYMQTKVSLLVLNKTVIDFTLHLIYGYNI